MGTEARLPPERLEVAVLGFTDDTGEPDSAHWGYVVKSVLAGKLRAVQSLRVLPDGEADYAFRQLNLKAGSPPGIGGAQRIARLIHARYVAWGAYRHEQGKWLVTAQVSDAAGERAPVRFDAGPADWPAALDQLAEQVVKELGVKLTAAERTKLGRRPTSSVAALDFYGRSVKATFEGKPAADLAAWARKAIAADPKYAAAHAALAAFTDNQAEAGQSLRTALKLRPDFARAHRMLGDWWSRQKHPKAAAKEWRLAAHLDPDDADNLCRLAELYISQGRQEQAVTLLDSASRLAPANPKIHARLGERLASEGQSAAALTELEAAERLAPAAATDQAAPRPPNQPALDGSARRPARPKASSAAG